MKEISIKYKRFAGAKLFYPINGLHSLSMLRESVPVWSEIPIS